MEADNSGVASSASVPKRNEGASFLINIYAKNNGLSMLNRRLLALHPGEQAIIGRISKNQKTDFIASSTNGYFDNPIISRKHAVLENRSNKVFNSDSLLTLFRYLLSIKSQRTALT